MNKPNDLVYLENKYGNKDVIPSINSDIIIENRQTWCNTI